MPFREVPIARPAAANPNFARVSGPFSFLVSQVPPSGDPIAYGPPNPLYPGQNIRLLLESFTAGLPADPVGDVSQIGQGPAIAVTGTPTALQTIVIVITTGGILGSSGFSWSLNGVLQASGVATAASVPLTSANLTAIFPTGTYVAGTSYTSTSIILTCQVENPGGQAFVSSPIEQSATGVWFSDFLIPIQSEGGTWQGSFTADSTIASQNAVGFFNFYVDSPGPSPAPPPPPPPPDPSPTTGATLMIAPIQIPGQPPYQILASYVVPVDARSGGVPLLAPVNPVDGEIFGVTDEWGAFTLNPCPVTAQGSGITIYNVGTNSYAQTASLVGNGAGATYYFRFIAAYNQWAPA